MILLPFPVLRCNQFLSRARGLLGREHLLDRYAFLLTPCRGVHTFGMQVAIDLAFLDHDHRVLEVVPSLRPCRWRTAREPRTHACLEAAAGHLDVWAIRVGTRLCFPSQGRLA